MKSKLVVAVRREKENDYTDLVNEFYKRLKAQRDRYSKRLDKALEIGDLSLAAKMKERLVGLGKAKGLFKSSKNYLKDEHYRKEKEMNYG